MQKPNQELVGDDCVPSVFCISDLENRNHHFYQQKNPPQIFQPPLIPITHQLFHQQNHSFQTFQHQSHRLNLEHEPDRAQNPFFTVNFKLGLNESSCNRETVLNQEADSFAYGNGQQFSENRPHSLSMPHSWHPQEDPSIKEPFWKPLLRQCNEGREQEIEGNKDKPSRQVDESERYKNLDHKYRLFGELEAIYGVRKIDEANQTASGSALTRESSHKNTDFSMPSCETHRQDMGTTGFGYNAIKVDNGSENSIGEEALLSKIQKRKRERKTKEKFSSTLGFFESLVKQVINHQESLHRKLLEVIEKVDKARTAREESWRHQEAAKHNRDAIAKAHEQALASNREALIFSYIEKITGQSINLPTRKSPLLLQLENGEEPIKDLTPTTIDTNTRWPQAEVEALIRVRSSFESRFQEPGLKGPVWEEISSLMASMGYQRSATRCKEKWENINKYFKKTKESGKRRSRQSKTCSYFDQLDQIYSGIPTHCASSKPLSECQLKAQRECHPDILEGFVVEGDLENPQNILSESPKLSKMGSLKMGFDGIVDEREGQLLSYEKQEDIHEDEDEDEDDNGLAEEHEDIGGDSDGD